MADLLSTLGISSEVYESVEAQQVSSGSTAWEPAVYDVAVEQAFVRKTDSGANMLHVDFITRDGQKLFWSTCILSGNEKGNKSTYVKDGKELPLPGVVEMNHFQAAAGKPLEVKEGQVKFKDQTINALCLTKMTGAKLKIGVINEENTYNGNTTLRNAIRAFLTLDGKNSAGEDMLEKLEESIAKNPIKKEKKQAAQTTTVSSGSEAAQAAASGW